MKRIPDSSKQAINLCIESMARRLAEDEVDELTQMAAMLDPAESAVATAAMIQRGHRSFSGWSNRFFALILKEKTNHPLVDSPFHA